MDFMITNNHYEREAKKRQGNNYYEGRINIPKSNELFMYKIIVGDDSVDHSFCENSNDTWESTNHCEASISVVSWVGSTINH